MKIDKFFIIDNLKTIFYALIIAIAIRSIIIQPFYIPSSSMEPNLLVGDRLFVTKFSYGYSKHSFPFSPQIFNGRILNKKPKRGDVIVFKTPTDNRTDYIKRLIGLPGDQIQIFNGNLFINNNQVLNIKISTNDKVYCGSYKPKVDTFIEKLPNGKEYISVYNKDITYSDSYKHTIPDKYYFFLGDNRDCSSDSRYINKVGYVHENNLVGKAQFIFYSSDRNMGSIFKFWKWNKIIRINRFFKKIN